MINMKKKTKNALKVVGLFIFMCVVFYARMAFMESEIHELKQKCSELEKITVKNEAKTSGSITLRGYPKGFGELTPVINHDCLFSPMPTLNDIIPNISNNDCN